MNLASKSGGEGPLKLVSVRFLVAKGTQSLKLLGSLLDQIRVVLQILGSLPPQVKLEVFVVVDLVRRTADEAGMHGLVIG
jgi:hypothetical protein